MRTNRILLVFATGLLLTFCMACPAAEETTNPEQQNVDSGNPDVTVEEMVPGFPVDRFRGKGLEEWIAEIESGDRFKCFKALVAVGEMEQDAELAVPAIQKVLADPESDQQLKSKAISALGRIGGDRAMVALRPDMIGTHDVLGILAADAYGQMGSESVEAVLPFLESENSTIRFRGVRALRGALQTEGKLARLDAAVVPLAHCLSDEDERVQADALEVLSELGARAAAAKPVIIERLKRETRAGTKKILMVMIGSYGPDSIDALDVLRENLEDEDRQVQLFAALAVCRVGQLDEGLPYLIAMLESDDYQIRLGAADALRRLGPAAKAAVEPLKQARKGADEPMHVMIEQALKSIREE